MPSTAAPETTSSTAARETTSSTAGAVPTRRPTSGAQAPVRTDLSFKIGGRAAVRSPRVNTTRILTTVENAIGGAGDDEMIGGEGDNILSGGPAGADIICGGLGVDTVDDPDRTTPVRVSLDGSRATDPNLGGRPPHARIAASPRHPQGFGRPPGVGAHGTASRNDGADADGDGVAEEGDCVGEDTENIRGGLSGDTLIGNDPDPRIGQAPRVEPRGCNRLTGGAGNDRLDGQFGPDVFEGGSGIDTLTYAETLRRSNRHDRRGRGRRRQRRPDRGRLRPGRRPSRQHRRRH